MVKPNGRQEPTWTGGLGREDMNVWNSFGGLLAPLILLLLHPFISVLGPQASWGYGPQTLFPDFIAAAC